MEGTFLMQISLQSNSILLKIEQNSTHLHPILHFIENSFKDIRYSVNTIKIFNSHEEITRKKYLLKWLYKVIRKQDENIYTSFLKIKQNLFLPIYIETISTKPLEKTISITIEHLAKNNELKIKCNEYNKILISSFQRLFKNTIVFSFDRKNFKIKILTKSDLLILKSLLSRKKICGVSVIFITHSLNFAQFQSQKDNDNEAEKAYKTKLLKSYKALGVHKSTSHKEIKKNYKELLKKYHPDRVSNQGKEAVQLYTKRFQIIQEAYTLVKENLSIQS